MIDFNNNELSIMIALCREQLNNQTGLYIHETLVNIISKIEKHLYDNTATPDDELARALVSSKIRTLEEENKIWEQYFCNKYGGENWYEAFANKINNDSNNLKKCKYIKKLCPKSRSCEHCSIKSKYDRN